MQILLCTLRVTPARDAKRTLYLDYLQRIIADAQYVIGEPIAPPSVSRAPNATPTTEVI